MWWVYIVGGLCVGGGWGGIGNCWFYGLGYEVWCIF